MVPKVLGNNLDKVQQLEQELAGVNVQETSVNLTEDEVDLLADVNYETLENLPDYLVRNCSTFQELATVLAEHGIRVSKLVKCEGV